MTTKEVANRLVELCRQGNYSQAHTELYANHAVSIEPKGAPSGELTEGMEAISAKGKQFEDMVEEVFSMEVSEPIVSDSFFSIIMGHDIKMKGMPRMKSDEVCVYEVNDGKIVKEQFFYPVQAM